MAGLEKLKIFKTNPRHVCVGCEFFAIELNIVDTVRTLCKFPNEYGDQVTMEQVRGSFLVNVTAPSWCPKKRNKNDQED
jgi:hypothetical protein